MDAYTCVSADSVSNQVFDSLKFETGNELEKQLILINKKSKKLKEKDKKKDKEERKTKKEKSEEKFKKKRKDGKKKKNKNEFKYGIIRKINCNICESINIEIEPELQQYVCLECGSELNEQIFFDDLQFENSESKILGNNKTEKKRCNFNVNELLPKISTSTIITNRNIPSHIRNMHNWSGISNKENSLMQLFKKIEKLCQDSNISVASINYTKILINKVQQNQKKSYRGSNRTGIIGACILQGCSKYGQINITIEYIAQLLNINVRNIVKAIEFLNLLRNMVSII